jgi:hypothetical protein
MTGPELRAALEELDIPNTEFHRLTGFHEQTISKWCCGRLRVPKHVELIVGLLRYTRRLEAERTPQRSSTRMSRR